MSQYYSHYPSLALIIHLQPDISLSAIQQLVTARSDPYQFINDIYLHRSALTMAMNCHREDIFMWLLDFGADVNVNFYYGGMNYNILTFGIYEPPHYLSAVFNTGKFRLNINHPDLNGYTVLAHLFGAINIMTQTRIRYDDDYTPMIRLLLSYGANLHITNQWGVSIYDCALTLHPRYMQFF